MCLDERQTGKSDTDSQRQGPRRQADRRSGRNNKDRWQTGRQTVTANRDRDRDSREKERPNGVPGNAGKEGVGLDLLDPARAADAVRRVAAESLHQFLAVGKS